MSPRRWATLVLLPLVAVPSSAQATRCGTDSPLDQRLRATALAAVEATNHYLVTGTGPDAVWLDRAFLDVRRASMAETDVRYTWSRASIVTFEVTPSRPAIVLHAEVTEELGMAGTNGNTGVPESTSGRTKMHFTFLPEAGDWQLVAIRADHFGDPYVDC